jgi:mRNA-degrading endonuclease RelE of RelBE toxin-antitoxin system
MEFRIADTFIDSLARLTNEEQKAVKMTAFDLQIDPSSPGMHFHKLERLKDNRFWSIRVTDDIRLIVHKTDSCLLLCYAGHHDNAYRWAEKRRLDIHPKTGAAQIVEIRETVQEIVVPKYVDISQTENHKPFLFKEITDETLLSYGIPQDWIGLVRESTEDNILDLATHLPGEAAEALLNLAVGIIPPLNETVIVDVDPFNHPDAQRRFRIMNNIEDLERALEYPWEKWTVFLHPEQRLLVERSYNGPVRVSGSAGTGKTIVALHRAVFLARNNPEARVLLTTFSETLANALRGKLRILIGNEPRIAERLEIYSINAIAQRLYEFNFGRQQIASPEAVWQILLEAKQEVDDKQLSPYLLIKEWEDVIDAWQLYTWEEYRDVQRVGKKRRLTEKQRMKLWEVFDKANEKIRSQQLITYSCMFNKLAELIASRKQPVFDFAIIDEAQDVTVSQLKFLAALGGNRPNGLFFTGDLGQRIFQAPFSWKALGIDVRGRSKTLRINYRTSHQIRVMADRLIAPEISDVDGNLESRKGTISQFNGPDPSIIVLDCYEKEIDIVSQWLKDEIDKGISAHEIGVFVRSISEFSRAFAAIKNAGLLFTELDEGVETLLDHVSVGTMHLAKGMEFRAVVVMCCDDEVIPMQERIESAMDDSDLEEIYNTERHLLYVACTRARDHLLVTGIEPSSEFLDDLLINPK